MWTSSNDLLATIHDAHARLKAGTIDPDAAHAEARLLGAATRILGITLEHAHLTDRLVKHSPNLPGMTIDIPGGGTATTP